MEEHSKPDRPKAPPAPPNQPSERGGGPSKWRPEPRESPPRNVEGFRLVVRPSEGSSDGGDDSTTPGA